MNVTHCGASNQIKMKFTDFPISFFRVFFVNNSQKYVALGWTIATVLLLSMVFGPTQKELSRTSAMLYTGLGKTAWSLGVAWYIVACACGRGGIVNRVLSAKCLLPYSRMSYTAYLINPLVIMFGVMMCEAPIHMDFVTLVSLFDLTHRKSRAVVEPMVH